MGHGRPRGLAAKTGVDSDSSKQVKRGKHDNIRMDNLYLNGLTTVFAKQ